MSEADSDTTSTDDEATAWVPEVGGEVLIYPGSDAEVCGTIVDDFGEFVAQSVEVNDVTIAAPARRWAALTTGGHLVFVDSEQLTSPPRSSNNLWYRTQGAGVLMVPPQRSRRARGRQALIDTDALYRAVVARGVEQSMSMRQLAVEIGVSNSLLSRLRLGRVPDTQRFASIVRYLDLPAEHLVADQHEAAGAAQQVL